MYIVLSKQDGRDTSVPGIAPRLVTEDPHAAIRAARETFEDEYEPFVAGTVIYRMELGTTYGVRNSKDPDSVNGEAPFIVAFVARNRSGDESKVVERFFDSDLAAVAGAEVYEFEPAV